MKYKEFKFEVGQQYINHIGNVSTITHVGERILLYKSKDEEYSATMEQAKRHWEKYEKPTYYVAFRYVENHITDTDWQISSCKYESVKDFLCKNGESHFKEVILLKSKED